MLPQPQIAKEAKTWLQAFFKGIFSRPCYDFLNFILEKFPWGLATSTALHHLEQIQWNHILPIFLWTSKRLDPFLLSLIEIVQIEESNKVTDMNIFGFSHQVMKLIFSANLIKDPSLFDLLYSNHMDVVSFSPLITVSCMSTQNKVVSYFIIHLWTPRHTGVMLAFP
jgi:hypothetical protein